MHTPLAPSDAEWKHYVELMRHAEACITISDGGTSSLAQRTELSRALAGRVVKEALITDAVFMRQVARARGLLLPSVRAFGPAEAPAAFTHVGVSNVEGMMRMLYALQKQLPPLRSFREMHHASQTRAAVRVDPQGVTSVR